MPFRGSQMVFGQPEILTLNTLRRTREITDHVVKRSIRRAQLFQLARRSWGKADRRHARERNPPIFGWQQLLAVGINNQHFGVQGLSVTLSSFTGTPSLQRPMKRC